MARWLITGCSTGFGREIARAALEDGHSVVVTARRADAVRDFVDEFGDRALAVALDVTDRRPDRGGGRGGRGGIRRDRRPGQQRRSRLPVGGGGGRGRRGAKAVRRQLLRCRRHDQGGAAGDAGPRVGPHRQHLVDDRSGGQPAQRVLLVDEVRAGGGDRGAGHRGAAAGHQGDRHRARRLPHRLGDAIDEGVGQPRSPTTPTWRRART